jgi:hypothetical protein
MAGGRSDCIFMHRHAKGECPLLPLSARMTFATCSLLKTVVERESGAQRCPQAGEVSTQLLTGFAVVPAQFYPDPARVICSSFVAKGTAVADRLLSVVHLAKCFTGVPAQAGVRTLLPRCVPGVTRHM